MLWKLKEGSDNYSLWLLGDLDLSWTWKYMIGRVGPSKEDIGGFLVGRSTQRLKMLPKQFFFFLLISSYPGFHQNPGGLGLSLYRDPELVQDFGLSSCSFHWPVVLWVMVEFSLADATHRQPLAASK